MLWLCLRVGAAQIILPDNGGTLGAYIFCFSEQGFWLALTDVSLSCGHYCDRQQSLDCGAWTVPSPPRLSQPASPSPDCRVACNTCNTAANISSKANNEILNIISLNIKIYLVKGF